MVRSRTESSRGTIRGDLMRITRVPAPVVVIALVACSGQRAATGTGAAEWPVGATPIITIGATEADPGEELAQVTGARWAGGRIIIANSASHELRGFDSAGKFLGAAGRKGQG